MISFSRYIGKYVGLGSFEGAQAIAESLRRSFTRCMTTEKSLLELNMCKKNFDDVRSFHSKFDREWNKACPKEVADPCPKEPCPVPKEDKPLKAEPCAAPANLTYDQVEESARQDVCLVKKEANDSCDPIPCCPDEPVVEEEKVKPKIVVVGAGIAGLTAAKRLIEFGYDNLIILEGSYRPGGRIMSQWFADVVVELGAEKYSLYQWDNPIMYNAVLDGHVRRPLSGPDPTKGLLGGVDDRSTSLVGSLFGYSRMNKILNGLKRIKGLVKERDKCKVHEYTSIRMKQVVYSEPKELAIPAVKVMYGIVSTKMREINADDLNVSNESVGPFLEAPGCDFKIPLGKVEELSNLIGTVSNRRIIYNKIVTQVKWGTITANQLPRAIIRTSDGTDYTADYVIMTTPLGTMKRNINRLFSPPLPFPKLQALNAMNFGHVNKIFIEYPLPFWIWRENPIDKSWNQEEMKCRCDWTKGITRLHEVVGSDRVLAVRIVGKEAIHLERETEENILNVLEGFVKDAIRKCTPKPVRILKSGWSTNQFYLGSHGVVSPSSTRDDLDRLAEFSSPIPVSADDLPPVVFFAGEASSVGHSATVDGAKLSGIREADKIIKYIKKSEQPEVPSRCQIQRSYARCCA